MRALGFILTFTFLLCNVSLAGSTDSKLPHIGLFSYTGSPIVSDAPAQSPMLLAMAAK